MTALAIRYHHQTNSNNLKENYPPDDRDGVFDRYINSIPILNLCLNMSIPAVIAIVCFSLATLPGNPYYYQFPMCIIGKVYANSMLVLINSRMLLGSEKASSTIISALKFTSASANNKDSAIHAHNGDVALDAKTPGALKGSHPEAV
jgi:hypothetical protein